MKLKFDIDKVTSKGICIQFRTEEEAEKFFGYMYSFGFKIFKPLFSRWFPFPSTFRIYKKNEDIEWSWNTESYYIKSGCQIYNYKNIEIPEYPCYKILKYGKIIVEFNDEDSGYCVIGESPLFKYMRYSKTWIENNFRKLTSEEHIEYHEILKKYKEDKERLLKMNNKDNKMETKYRIKEDKTINVEQIMNCPTHKCREGLNSFLIHFGANDVDWNKENEDWIANNVPGGIDWLYSNGFIEENEEVLDKKFYFCFISSNYGNSAGFLSKVSNVGYNDYMWTTFNGIQEYFSSEKYSSIEEAIHDYNHYPWKVKGFNTLQDGLEYCGLINAKEKIKEKNCGNCRSWYFENSISIHKTCGNGTSIYCGKGTDFRHCCGKFEER